MRILFDSKSETFKAPFGCLVPGQPCRISIHIPPTALAVGAQCVVCGEDGVELFHRDMLLTAIEGDYGIYSGEISFAEPGLYFYYFYIRKAEGGFRLFKAGDGTNMEAGDKWQISCIPADFTTPDWAKGGVIYQIFPDRFHKAGVCDLTGKLTPYTLHENWEEEVHWRPNEKGEVLNNDFFGGNFRGITEKLDYIASLGATIIYLNPISKSFSSHRYDTGDYKTPDPMLGTEEDFKNLCEAAHKRGIRVILDGVYSHTGSNSLYFNREGSFESLGAYQSEKSPYYSWFTFHEFPGRYDSWWGFKTLPTVKKMDPAFMEYIITGEDSVIEHWLRLGADGFRLDVADELPDGFIAALKKHLRKLRPDALLMGEVWEDASNKIAYDTRRRYFVDGELDSIMNYPFRTAILNFVRGEDTGEAFADSVMTIAENYPTQVLCCNMNLLGTHDTPRILTALVDDFDGSREELAARKLSKEQRELAVKRLKIAIFLQFALPGCPSIYYGDEAGMEGGKDPFNRRTYPWGKEDKGLVDHFRYLGELRKRYPDLREGDVRFIHSAKGRIAFVRGAVKCYVNRTDTPWILDNGEMVPPMAWRVE